MDNREQNDRACDQGDSPIFADTKIGTVPEKPTGAKRRRKWLIAAIKLLIVAVVVWFIRGFVVDALEGLAKHRFHVDFWWLAASGGLYLLGSLFCGLFWHRILRTLGQETPLLRTLRAFYIGHLGKYVPGKAMVVVLRAGLIRGPGVEASLAVVSVFFETLTMMAVGAMMAATIVAVCFREQIVLFWASLGMMAVAGLPTLPSVFRILVRILVLGKLSPSTLEKLDALDYKVVAWGWVLNVVGWVFLGLSFWAVTQSLGVAGIGRVGQANRYPGGASVAATEDAMPQSVDQERIGLRSPTNDLRDLDPPYGEIWGLEQLPRDTAAVSVATVGGFLSFVPGGAVVREGLLTVFTAPHLGGDIAFVAAILLRLAWLVAELVMAGVLSFGKIRVGRGHNNASQPPTPNRLPPKT